MRRRIGKRNGRTRSTVQTRRDDHLLRRTVELGDRPRVGPVVTLEWLPRIDRSPGPDSNRTP
jgi:hypothetical protein